MDSASTRAISATESYVEPLELEVIPAIAPSELVLSSGSPAIAKATTRTSLKASTVDGVFATIFSNITGGVLLTNFLIELGANPSEIGMLASIPMVANLVQPLGAHLADQTTSRHNYCFWVYGISRLLWLILAIGIIGVGWREANSHLLIMLTLGVALLSYVLGALGSAPWLSWMAALVPRRLRGRYFGFRNSAANLTNLICVPMMGFAISQWFGGSVQGFGVMLMLGVVAGLISLWFQGFMADVNPQEVRSPIKPDPSVPFDPALLHSPSLWQNHNFLMFVLYFSLWMFAVNLSAPFFNLYMLDNLNLDISQVTLYSSLTAGANLLMLVLWGKLADRIGNRPILISVGILVAATPLLWLMTDSNAISIWLLLPLLHLLSGGTLAAIDLCSSNLQLGIAPLQNQSTCFGIVAAVAGISGAIGTMAGGVLAQFGSYEGLLGVFAISSVLRLGALLPLLVIRE